MKSKNDMRIKRKLGALVVLGILGIIAFGSPVTADLDNLIWLRDDTGQDVSLSASYPNYDVGIGTDAPSAKLHVVGDVTIDSGDLNVDSGTLFVDESADRLGIGDTSPDFKLEVTGSSGSGYFGVTSSTDGDIFIIDGSGNVGIGTNTPDAKFDVELSLGEAVEIGSSGCSATGTYAVAMGDQTTASGTASFASGYCTEATREYATATGFLSSASHCASFAAVYANASGMGSVSMGWLARAEGDLSYAMGSLVQATADCSMVLGRGDAVHGDLINNIESSLVIGFDSTTPTFYVDGSSVGVGTTSPVTTLDINGGLATNIGPQVSNYTSSAADHTILVDASLGGAVTVTLRPAANAQGQILVIKKIDSSGSGVTVDANGAETIDGSLSYTISSQWDTVTIQSDGSNWYILSKIT